MKTQHLKSTKEEEMHNFTHNHIKTEKPFRKWFMKTECSEDNLCSNTQQKPENWSEP